MNVVKVSDGIPNLTRKQDTFVEAYVANGGKGTAAAKEAGYAEKSAHVEACRLLRNPLIIQEIYKRSTLAIGASLPKAFRTIERLSSEAKSEYVQLEASKDLLDRVGLKAPERIDHRVDGTLNVSIDLG